MTGSLRRVVLGDGVQALALSTGGGLDFAVLIDRSLDIGPLAWRGEHVGWESPSGFRHPAGHDPHADDGRGFNRLFSGFLVTAGLGHIRQPADGHPLHGSLPFTPAALTASGADDRVLFCEGEVHQPGFRLRRRIEAAAGGSNLAIVDTVESTAPAPQRQASLYHFNIGSPALANGTIVRQGMVSRLDALNVPDPWASLDSVSYPVDDGGAECTVETPRLAVKFAWNGENLPHLQLWHDLRPGRCVLSVEPCTSRRLPGGASGEEPLLMPGARRRYVLSISFADRRS
jgi:hypothetical protein